MALPVLERCVPCVVLRLRRRPAAVVSLRGHCFRMWLSVDVSIRYQPDIHIIEGRRKYDVNTIAKNVAHLLSHIHLVMVLGSR